MSNGRYAIIDLGSNAIRASVYNSNLLNSQEIYNDKFKSDLSNLLDLDNIDVKHHTYITFQHFIHIFDKLEVKNIKCIATAVLRGHPNAQKFIQLIKEKFGITIEIISGEEEAKLGALGVTMTIRNTHGIVTDFGGGSLELCTVFNNHISNLVSLPIGSKIIAKNKDISVEELINLINEYNSLPTNQNLYFIGGSLRLIGRLYINHTKYPLSNLHTLEISKISMLNYLDKIDEILASQQIGSTYITLINIENLPVAIKITRALITVFNPEKIIISNYGLKEGVRFANLSPEEQKKDIIYERCKKLFDAEVSDIDIYKKLILNLVLNLSQSLEEVVELSLILANGYKNFDKSQRASHLSELILACDIPFNHKLRVKLALALSFAYRSKNDLRIHKLSKKLISSEEYYNSQIIGNILRITRHIDGPCLSKPSFQFNLKGSYIEIATDKILPKSIFNKICGHLKDISFARKRIQAKNFQYDD